MNFTIQNKVFDNWLVINSKVESSSFPKKKFLNINSPKSLLTWLFFVFVFLPFPLSNNAHQQRKALSALVGWDADALKHHLAMIMPIKCRDLTQQQETNNGKKKSTSTTLMQVGGIITNREYCPKTGLNAVFLQ